MIPVSSPLHPMHNRLERERAKKLGLVPPAAKPAPYRYEDQYGNMRWSDTHDRVKHAHGGR